MRVERFGAKAVAGLAMLVVAVTAVAGAAGAGPTGASATATAQASARVFEPLTLTATKDLRFGRVAGSAEDGTVTVKTSGERFATGGAKLTGQSADFGPAEFTIGGEPSASYSIAFVPGSLTATKEGPAAGGSATLAVVDPVAFSTTAGKETTTGLLDPDGTDTVFVGGTLEVPANAAGGEYEAEIELTLTFQ